MFQKISGQVGYETQKHKKYMRNLNNSGVNVFINEEL
jgi:hypothetical protein